MDQLAQVKLRKYAIIGVVVLILISTGAFAASRLFATTCLTAADYQTFYGSEPDVNQTFLPGDPFFTGSYQFIQNSSSIDTTESDAPTEDIEGLANFYKSHANKPMLFSVATQYEIVTSNSKEIAKARVNYIKDLLEKAGVPSEVIISSASVYIQPSTARADTPGYTDTVSLTLTSADSCK